MNSLTKKIGDMTAFVSYSQWGGIVFSFLSRGTFALLLYRNQSKKLLSCTVCAFTILSNSCWLPYALSIHSSPLLIRSAADIIIAAWGCTFILYNRIIRDDTHNGLDTRDNEGSPIVEESLQSIRVA